MGIRLPKNAYKRSDAKNYLKWGRDAKKVAALKVGEWEMFEWEKTALQKKKIIYKKDKQYQYFPNFATIMTLDLLINITIFLYEQQSTKNCTQLSQYTLIFP